MSHDAQNPYGSFAVSASAGAGKTYQLTQRYMKLVAAGAEPQSILTITFTRKAAAEMRERILQEAARLGRNPEYQEKFSAEVAGFFENYQNTKDFPVKPPRSAKETSDAILVASQAMRITTIDAAFWDWFRKFPWESESRFGNSAADSSPDEATLAMGNPTLCDESQSRDLNDEAWEIFVQEKLAHYAKGEFDFLSQRGVYGLQDRINELNNYTTYAWLQERVRPDGRALNLHSLPETSSPDLNSVFNEISPALEVLAADISATVAEQVRLAISEKSLTRLLDSSFLTKSLGVSKTYLREKKREKYAQEIALVEAVVKNFENARRLNHLNHWGATLFAFYEAYTEVRERLKRGRGMVEFSDLAKGAFQLFHSEDAAGARYLIHRNTKHILIDEFQDTSRLQWAIFAKLAEEILSGEGLSENEPAAPPSIFIVGDDKQSVYGFREADPSILAEAKEKFAPFGLNAVDLNENYRSAGLILGFANELFADLINHYPAHASAKKDDGVPLIADHGRIVKAPLFTPGEGEDMGKAREAEAKFIAEFIKQAVSGGENRWQVYDKALQTFRPLSPRDCVLLFRFSTHAEIYEQALRKAGLACVRDQAGGFFERPEITDLVALLRFLAYPVDLLSLATVLKSPMTGMEDEDLIYLLQMSLADGGKGNQKRLGKILELLAKKSPPTYQSLERLTKAARFDKPTQILLAAIKEFCIFERYDLGCVESEALLAKANILQFTELLVTLEKQGHSTLHTLCMQLDKLKSNEQYGNASMHSNAVTLMTIHKAKGLEFPFVALVDSAKPWEKRDRYWAKGKSPTQGEGLFYIGTSPDRPIEDEAFKTILAEADQASRAENIRLLYVALTRAKQYLLVSGYQEKKDVNEESFYTYMAQAMARLGAKTEQNYQYLETLSTDAKFTSEVEAAVAIPTLAEMAPAFTGAEDFKPTQIKTIRHSQRSKIAPGNPKSVPRQVSHRPPSQARAYGVLVHAGLEAHVKGEKFNGERIWAQVFLEEPELLAEYKDTLIGEATLAVAGVVNSSVWQSLTADSKKLEAEVPLVHLVDEQMFSGRIDLCIEGNNGDLTLIDYKTTAEEDEDAFEAQLQSYAQAIKHMHPKAKVTGKVLFTHSLSLKELFSY